MLEREEEGGGGGGVSQGIVGSQHGLSLMGSTIYKRFNVKYRKKAYKRNLMRAQWRTRAWKKDVADSKCWRIILKIGSLTKLRAVFLRSLKSGTLKSRFLTPKRFEKDSRL